jgi:hypothetical protein
VKSNIIFKPGHLFFYDSGEGSFNLALKGEDYFLGRGLHPSLNKGFKKPLPKGRGLLYEIKSIVYDNSAMMYKNKQKARKG